jgi:hypothetical protein
MIVPSDELYHWGWKKKDAKYIKREWKNGRWQYTYAADLKADYQKKANAAATYSKQAKSARAKNIANEDNLAPKDRPGENFSTVKKTSRVFDLERAAKKAENKYYATTAGKVKKYIDDAKKDWKESKERGTEKAKADATHHSGAYVSGRKVEKTFSDTDNLLSRNTTIRFYGTEIRGKHRGKIERYIDTAQEYIKDRLGYDERDAARTAIAKYDYAQRAEKDYQDVAAAKVNFMGTVNPRTGEVTYTDNQKKEIKTIERNKKMLRDKTAKAGKEASAAANAYINTPVGKLDVVSKVGEELFERLFGRKR